MARYPAADKQDKTAATGSLEGEWNEERTGRKGPFFGEPASITILLFLFYLVPILASSNNFGFPSLEFSF